MHRMLQKIAEIGNVLELLNCKIFFATPNHDWMVKAAKSRSPFRKKAPSQMFGWILYTSLEIIGNISAQSFLHLYLLLAGWKDMFPEGAFERPSTK